MKALITGISGFAGMHLAQHLLSLNDQVLGLNRAKHQLTLDQFTASCFAWDITTPFEESPPDTQFAVNAFSPDVIYHLAALSVPALCGSPDPSAAAFSVNVQGTKHVLELADQLPDCNRVIFISSSHVYQSVDVEHPVVSEDSPTNPQNGYGKTKLAAENLSIEFSKVHNLDIIIARAFQHTGPAQIGSLMLPEWLTQINNPDATKISIHTCDAHLDLSDVRDIVAAYRCLAIAGESATIYNIGSGISRKTGDLLKQLQNIAQDSRPVEELFPRKKQDPIADVTRLKEVTTWAPKFSIEQTLSDSFAAWNK